MIPEQINEAKLPQRANSVIPRTVLDSTKKKAGFAVLPSLGKRRPSLTNLTPATRKFPTHCGILFQDLDCCSPLLLQEISPLQQATPFESAHATTDLKETSQAQAQHIKVLID